MTDRIVEPCSVRIRKALAIRNMSQTELCTKAKISKSSLSEYLKGLYEPKQDKIFVLAQVLNVDPMWLWGHDVPMEKKEQPEQNKISPGKDQLTEEDLELLQIFRLIPEEMRRVYLEQGRAFANSLKKD